MAKSKTPLTNGEIEILQIIWPLGECGIREVHDALSMRRRIALSTIAVRMAKMEKKGLIEAVDGRRPRLYRPQVEQQDTSVAVVHDVLDRMFNGSAVQLIQLVLRRKKLTQKDRDAVREQLDKLK